MPTEVSRKAWMGHENVLATAIRDETSATDDDLRPAVTAYFVLEAIAFAIRSADPRRALDTAFNVIGRSLSPACGDGP
jgi:hypothetical protein